MAGPGDPPEGTPEGVPGGGDDDYRSVVFDESFVRAARLQEFSAQERLGDRAPAVRDRTPWDRGRGHRQVILLVVLITLAFSTAVYLGVRSPYQAAAEHDPGPLRSSVLPLAPRGSVPGAAPDTLFEHSPAAEFRVGADGVSLPAARRTGSFTDSQVLAALDAAKEYIVRSSLDPEVLTGGTVRPVRVLVDPQQQEQFDRSMEDPADDGRHAASGWLVRFDPDEVALADPGIRVRGSLAIAEAGPDQLEVTGDHTFVYALSPADAAERAEKGDGGNNGNASLFTVRRETRFRFDRGDLRDHRVEVVQSQVHAGPMSCAADTARYLRPLLAGERADRSGPAETDPFAPGRSTPALCGELADEAQPDPPRGSRRTS
ncbi:membrane protein [Streptomyces albus]|uniref:SCO2583 family membrane protein n=1 Tax=Streptomyces albus TaxID=1888 RepID=UPI0004CA5A00|nr:membrane protein [Streptomyces albus]